MNSEVGKGSSGFVFGGHIVRLPQIQLVAKHLPVHLMEQELVIWRRLRSLAGIKIPGLFGAYVFKGNRHAILLQQDAGQTLKSFELLSQEQR